MYAIQFIQMMSMILSGIAADLLVFASDNLEALALKQKVVAD